MISGDQWYWCFDHNRAEAEGQQCRAESRLGPYRTKQAAEDWKSTAEQRNEVWEEQDREWRGD